MVFTQKKQKDSLTGFTLVELSIVLVILGLLVGGVLTGQSLIRAAELRSITNEYGKFATAINTFRDKYFAFPGDMANAESYWGTAAGGYACRTTSSSTAATCNGDGDGNIDLQSSSGASMENYRFWQHLANAGLIEGTYTGVVGATGGMWDTRPGQNVAASKISGAGYAVVSKHDMSIYAGWYSNVMQPTSVQHWFQFGKPDTGNNGNLYTPTLKPEEAYNIDTKMDDGKPGTGKLTTFSSSVGSCVSGTAEASLYRLDVQSIQCTLFIGF